jgi:ABC-2 type transport system permease protein
MDGEPDVQAILISLAVAAALAAVFLPITTRLYRSR